MEAVSAALSTIETLINVIPLAPPVKDLFSSFNYKAELESLKEILEEINFKMEAAQRKQMEGVELSPTDEALMEEMKSAICDAEDLLDEHDTQLRLHQLGLEIQAGNSVWSKVRGLLSPFKTVSLGPRAKRIKTALEGPASKFSFEGSSRTMKPETSSFVSEISIIGREEDKRRIIDILLDHTVVQTNVLVLSIVGMGGLGKTTLAQLVFNDPRVQSEFPDTSRFWVCVSDQGGRGFGVKAILASILKSVTGESNFDHQNVELEHLLQQLRGRIGQNKFLLVLDDVWTDKPNEWSGLEEPLLGLAPKGSKIMLTTRSKVTANVVRSGYTHELRGLSDENSWRLFKITSGIDEARDHDLVGMGKDILAKCANVPLAIKVVGTLLRGQGANTWRSFHQRKATEVRKDGNEIVQILKFSYYHLDLPLRMCFAYCALFPKDFEIKKELIISLWMAQGYVKPLDDGQSIEDAAEEYFEILVGRCFFQDVGENFYGEVVFKIHDLMHDLALEVAGKEISTATSDTKSIGGEKICHLYDLAPYNRTEGFTTKAKIRTYIAAGDFFGPRKMVDDQFLRSALLTNWSRVRVLSLGSLGITNLPDAIGKLLHLRHLDLSGNCDLKRLPESLTRLVNLQFLVLDGCRLEELPQDLSKLVNLRTLKVFGDGLRYMPSGMDKMTCLTRLSTFVVGQRNSGLKHDVGQLKDLLSLTRLRGHLDIQITAEYKHAKENDDQGGYLRNMKDLTSIYVEWMQLVKRENKEERVRHDEDLLEDLQPPPDLKQLEIGGYGGERIQGWGTEDSLATYLPNLVSITLWDCDGIKELPRLGNLPYLKSLTLYYLDKLEYIEHERSSGTRRSSSSYEAAMLFPSLEQVHLSNLPNLKGWWREWCMPMYATGSDSEMLSNQSGAQTSASDEFLPSFPRLLILRINRCPNLRPIIPLCPPEKYLELDYYPNEGFKITIEKEEEEEEKEKREGNLKSRGDAPRIRLISTRKVRVLKSLPMLAFQWLTNMEIASDEELESLSEVEGLFRACSSSLRTLIIRNCKKLTSVTQGLQYLTALESLELSGLDELRLDERDGRQKEEEDENAYELPWKCFAHSLRSLTLAGLPKVEELPKGMSCLTALQSLHIRLLPLKEVPEWIGCLSSLQSLNVDCCLEMPEGFPNHCNRILYERCQKPDGEDWPKIQHIPQLQIKLSDFYPYRF